MSLSRAGAFVTLLGLLTSAGLLAISITRSSKKRALIFIGIAAIALSFAAPLVSGQLMKRLKKDTLAEGRLPAYKTALKMAKDKPIFGFGPGAFDAVFQLYRTSPDDYWPAQLHNDWLETLITFGAVGTTLLLAAFIIILNRCLSGSGVITDGTMLAFVWLSLVGCLLHATIDFPLQIYSIQFTVVTLCGILSTVSRRH